jgi:hypothetical protein
MCRIAPNHLHLNLAATFCPEINGRFMKILPVVATRGKGII